MTILSSLLSNNIADLNDSCILNILSYDKDSTLYDGTTNIYTALVDAVADLPTAGGIIFFPSTSDGGTYSLSTDYTLPSNCTLWITPGAKISIGAGITLTGTDTGIIAELTEIFSGTGTITGTFNTYALYNDWFAVTLTNTATVTTGAEYVLTSGDTMTGLLNLSTDGLKVGTNQLVVVNGIVSVNSTSPTDGKLNVVGSSSIGGIGMCITQTSTGRINNIKFISGGTTYEGYITLSPDTYLTPLVLSRSASNAIDLVISKDGYIGLNAEIPVCGLDMGHDRIRIRQSFTPPSSGFTSVPGYMSWDASYVYFSVGTDTWKRIPFSASTW